MKFIIDGVELESAENVRIGEMCEAERELGLSLEDAGTAGKFALMLFVALRRDNPEKPAGVVKEEVLNADMSSIEEIDDGPPAVADIESLRTTGDPISAKSA